MSKHAVARLSEGLFHDLKAEQADIGVTLLCPGMIATNILTSGRNRPNELETETSSQDTKSEMIQRMDTVFKTQGMPPRQVGELVADAVLKKQFYLLTHPENMQGVQRRFDDIVNLADATPPQRGGFSNQGSSQE